tara:strand:+ start:254 stop:586 length:333 start_codon:yes stop_codon:yes gene_type:complete
VVDQVEVIQVNVVVMVVLVVALEEMPFLQELLVDVLHKVHNQEILEHLVLEMQVVMGVKQETQMQVVVTLEVVAVVVLAQQVLLEIIQMVVDQVQPVQQVQVVQEKMLLL